ncbi:bifunctional cytochrome P450/NADPH--P450 reductase [Rhodococcus sp. CH91]|uniref:bifunctional cytochrome P450/NADPH--P450 reductase n=1 Tax=Rhodococcus sp. CH91 TaxID=2910256 RepID=UPI001F4A202A|nr:cytochrome P450 [Rhodococcus sp. CH91]
MSASRSIPIVRGIPILGNALQLSGDVPTDFLVDAAREHPDGIYQVDILGHRAVFVYDPDLVAEVCDETRFYKSIAPPLSLVRDFAGDGLFTARGSEPVWGRAHRILMPAFGQRSMKAYFPQMLEVAEDLIASWARRQREDLTVADDMTRLTLDTIALTGFGYRFDSFSSPDLHPFLTAMSNALTEAMIRARQPQLVTRMRTKRDEAYRADIRVMQELVDEVVRRRRGRDHESGTDLLGLMLDATDPRTGHALSDENIRNQVLTFLIAGHETTSGLLSFALYNLLRNPHVLAQAYREVDRLLPAGTVPTYEMIMKLDVIPRVLEETLRIWSPIPGIILKPFADTEIGRHPVCKGQQVFVLLPALHRHPKAWDRPDDFDIDRWLPENRTTHHPAGYKPFGNGERACIGRQFALTEAKLALALILRQFAISDPHAYRMRVKQTLTLKPDGFTVRVRKRQAHERATHHTPVAMAATREEEVDTVSAGITFTIAYGSNLGTCADIAERLAERASRSGFDVRLVTLDELAADPPGQGILAVITASYNGRAPDNAQFFDACSEFPPLHGVRLALLGCGDTQWPTYQAFPRRAFATLTAAGATPLIERGEADAAGDFDGDVSAWTTALWATLSAEYGTAAVTGGNRYRVEILTEADTRPEVISAAAVPLTVVENRELTGDPSGLWDFSQEMPRPGVRSIVAALPEGVSYAAGDHLAVFARNDPEHVRRALHLLRVPHDQVVRLRARGATHLPVGTPVTAGLLLTDFVELQEPATRSDLETLTAYTSCPDTRDRLTALGHAYSEEIRAKHVCVTDLLARFPAITLPLAVFLETVGPIRPRYYSISSSPLATPGHIRLTVGLVQGPSWSGGGRYRGMCSTYLADLAPGEVFYGQVRTPTPSFRLPADPTVPVILIGPGTGIAPLMGFLEERARTESTGQVELFTGCRHPEHDRLYGDDLDRWHEAGSVRVHTAYSALPDHPIRYVQHALVAQADRIRELLEQGAHIYVCGDGLHMAPAVRHALAQICTERTGDDGEIRVRHLEAEGRYHQDIFA